MTVSLFDSPAKVFPVTYTYLENQKDYDTFWQTPHGLAVLASNIWGIDTETSGLDPNGDEIRLIQIGVKFSDDTYYAVVIDKQRVTDLSNLMPYFQSKNIRKVFQNAKFDLAFLYSVGIEVSCPIFDTMLAYLIYKNGHPELKSHKAGLAELVKRYLDYDLDKEEQKGFSLTAKMTEAQLEYAARDACILIPLREVLVTKLKQASLIKVAQLEFEALHAVAELEYNGIGFNWDGLGDAENRLDKEAEESLQKFTDLLPSMYKDLFGNLAVNLKSSKDVLSMLREVTGVELKATDKSYLKLQPDPTGYLSEYLLVKKSITSAQDIKKLPKHKSFSTNRIHCAYKQLGCASGRMSAEKPNLQNIPRADYYRRLFIPTIGNKLIIADYSQMELRLLAEISNDKLMIQCYCDDIDLHDSTASLVNNIPIKEVTKDQRKGAKPINFGLAYGQGAEGLKNYAKIVYGVDMTLDEATRFRQVFFNSYLGVARWHKEVNPKNAVNEVPYVYTLSGRRRWVAPSDRRLQIYANTPIQGTGADILKRALTLVHARKRKEVKLVINVHDEIGLECPENMVDETAIMLQTSMVEAGQEYIKKVPIVAEVSIGDSWAEK